MTSVFLVCAVVGGAILVLQLLLAVVGLGAEAGADHIDLPSGLDADAADALGAADAHDAFGAGDLHDGAAGDESGHLFGLISLRTVVAAITFFGITGMIARSAKLTLPMQLVVAILGGLIALYVVAWVLNAFRRMSQEGTLQIRGAVGKTATVYVPVPGGRQTSGKVQLKLQDRLVEYEAVTSEPDTLPTGAKVLVVGVIGPNTLEVKRANMEHDPADDGGPAAR